MNKEIIKNMKVEDLLLLPSDLYKRITTEFDDLELALECYKLDAEESKDETYLSPEVYFTHYLDLLQDEDNEETLSDENYNIEIKVRF